MKEENNTVDINGIMPGAIWRIDLDLIDEDKREFYKMLSDQHLQSITADKTKICK